MQQVPVTLDMNKRDQPVLRMEVMPLDVSWRYGRRLKLKWRNLNWAAADIRYGTGNPQKFLKMQVLKPEQIYLGHENCSLKPSSLVNSLRVETLISSDTQATEIQEILSRIYGGVKLYRYRMQVW